METKTNGPSLKVETVGLSPQVGDGWNRFVLSNNGSWVLLEDTGTTQTEWLNISITTLNFKCNGDNYSYSFISVCMSYTGQVPIDD